MQLICGVNPVLEALGAGERHFDRLLVVKGLRNPRVSEAISRAGQRGIPLRFEVRETLDRLAGGVAHQGLIGVVSAKPTIGLEALLDETHDPALVVILDGIEDPRNLGAVLRSVEAAGADGVVLPERHSAGLSETVNRASAGALEHVRVARVVNLSQAIDRIKQRGLWVVGFDAAGPDRWDAVDYKRPLALVLGGEGRGIRRLVREHCDQLVSIPLFGHIASLNVSVVAGIALYEVVRQRGSIPSQVRPIPSRTVLAPTRVIGPPPSDTERDPGLMPDAGLAVGAHGMDPRAEELDGEPPRRLVRFHEEDLAWGRLDPHAGPPALGGRERRRRRRRRDRQPPAATARPAQDQERGGPFAPSGEAAAARNRSGSHRRRRRGRRGNGGKGVAGPPGGRAEGSPPSGDQDRNPTPPAGGAPGKRPRRRRRR